MQTPQLMSEYEISIDPHRLNIEIIHKFLAEDSYWSIGIPRAIVERAIQNSLCFGLYHGNAQVGFARVVTDRSTFALLADLFILDPHRGKGLSKWLMRSIVEHEDLQGLRRLLLLTSDAHNLYSRFGFRELGSPSRFMEVFRQDVYTTPVEGII
jgi:GNAT superfamily N-acetyltransferase